MRVCVCVSRRLAGGKNFYHFIVYVYPFFFFFFKKRPLPCERLCFAVNGNKNRVFVKLRILSFK